MASITEIAADVYRVSIYSVPARIQFNHFLVRDEEPLLVHAGLRTMFPDLRDAVARLLEPSRLRYVACSHFESDECGGLPLWAAAAPRHEVLCSDLGALVNLHDFLDRPARGLADGDVVATGRYRFRFCRTPHLPHGWDAGLFIEDTRRTLFCSDLFHQNGDVEPLVSADVVGRSRQSLLEAQKGLLAEYVPYTPLTGTQLDGLAALQPATLAVTHGSSVSGDGTRAVLALKAALAEVYGAAGRRP